MTRCGTRASLDRMVGCHWTMCSYEVTRFGVSVTVSGASRLAERSPQLPRRAYQCMRLGLLKVVAPVQRIEPRVEEELCPVPVPQQEAGHGHAHVVLRHDKVNVLGADVAKRLDDALGRHHAVVL